jgi:hypothetical protein
MAFGQKSADLLGNMPRTSLMSLVIPSEAGPLERLHLRSLHGRRLRDMRLVLINVDILG